MSVELDWYAINARRSYPLDDAASGVDDAGRPLPPDLLVDCSLRFPDDLGGYAFLAAATVAPGLVSMTFEACDRPARPSILAGPPAAAVFRPLGGVTVRAPFPIHEPIPIETTEGGVAGWIVLGPGCSSPYSGSFAGPGQAGLLPRCAIAAPRPPVTSLRVGAAIESLSGRVTIAGGSDVRTQAGVAMIDGRIRSALAIGLASGSRGPGRAALAAYAGPCGARPESRTCDPPAVETLGGVAPDADGDVRIRFSDAFAGLVALPLSGSKGGIVFDLPRTVSDVCPSAAERAAAAVEDENIPSTCNDSPPMYEGGGGSGGGGGGGGGGGVLDMDVLRGVFAVGPFGTIVVAAPAAAAKPADLADVLRIRTTFSVGGHIGNDGGVVFDYTPPGSSDGPASYRTAVFDLLEAKLVVTSIVGDEETVEGSADLSPAPTVEQFAGTIAEVVVSFDAGTPRRATVLGSWAHGAVTLTLDLPPLGAGGGYGLAAGRPSASFRSLEAGRD